MTRVLFVEDTHDLLETVGLELELNGYEVVQANSGRQALDYLESTDSLPDVIVSDIAMPDVNGYQLLATCQRQAEWSGIPFIFLTALSGREDILTGKKLGVDDYLVKPFRINELIIAIENKLRRVGQIKAGAERQLDHTRRELLTLIAHELRTPLSAIYGGAELLADSISNVPDSMSHRMLELVQSGAKRMRRLVDEIVFLTQLDSGSLAQSLEKIVRSYDMKIIIERAYTLLQEEWNPDLPPLTFNFYMPTTPIKVTGNPDFLVMMVSEGIRNAAAFSPKGGKVNVELRQDEQSAFITISDQGAGVAEDDLPRLFTRFVQINREKTEQQGMGLGLALVRESVRLHHGEATLENLPEGGMLFTLQLPLSTL